MVKILFICNNLIIGGVEKVCWEIVSNIDKTKYKIDFLVAIDCDVEQYYEAFLLEKGCRIYKGGCIRNVADKKRFLKKEQELIKLNQYSIVHSHMDFMNVWTLRVAKRQGVKKRISHVHTSFPDIECISGVNRIKYFCSVFLLSIYSNIRIGCSKSANNSFYPYISSKVIKNGFDITSFLKCGTSNKKKKKNIIVIGRFTSAKNPLFVCEVMCELIKLDPEFVLYWIGDGHLRQQVEEKIEICNLKNNIRLIGATTDVFPYLEICSSAVFPSICEGLGISCVETQLAGCFTFCSDIIPDEADIGYALKLPLAIGAKSWAICIYNYIMNDLYSQYKIDVEKMNQYDIHNVIKCFEDIYDV